MIVRMGLLTKRRDLSDSAFSDHWKKTHRPLAAKLPGLRTYHQNHVVDREQRAISYARGEYDFDGVSELWFDDLSSMNAAMASPEAAPVIADEANFIEGVSVLTAVQHVIIDRPAGVPLIKRVSTLKRRPDIDAETFKREWFDVHSFLVKRVDGVRGYTQNLVLDRAIGRERTAYDDLAIDGMVELWFDDVETLRAGFASDAGTTLMTHAKEFISEISTFLVEVHEVR